MYKCTDGLAFHCRYTWLIYTARRLSVQAFCAIPKCLSIQEFAFSLLFSVLTRDDFRAICFDSLQCWQTKSSGMLALRILAHDQWIHLRHSEHSIIGRPPNGFPQKHVTACASSLPSTSKAPVLLSTVKHAAFTTDKVDRIAATTPSSYDKNEVANLTARYLARHLWQHCCGGQEPLSNSSCHP